MKTGEIGPQIKSIRKSLRLTQYELAAKAGISRSYLADVENNRYHPSISTLEKIAAALNVQVEQLAPLFFDIFKDPEINKSLVNLLTETAKLEPNQQQVLLKLSKLNPKQIRAMLAFIETLEDHDGE